MANKILRQSMLMGISKDGGMLTLLDGSKWVVSPEYVSAVSKWKPTSEIVVTVGYPGSEWPYQIVNGEGMTAMAYRRRPTQQQIMTA